MRRAATRFSSTAGNARRSGARVLVAEDNAVNQVLLNELLSPHVAELKVVDDGESAIRAASTSDYDLVLMDLHMPEMDGIKAAAKIQQTLPAGQKPRIVAMTANVLPGDRIACREAGMQDFLAKPINLDQLYRILSNMKLPSGHKVAAESDDGAADIEFAFGAAGDIPIAGDWGVDDGIDTVAVYRPDTGTFFFRHDNSTGPADETFELGVLDAIPLAGSFGLDRSS